MPLLAKGRVETGHCWTYVRDDRPFGGPDPAAAVFYFSRNRKAEHPQAHLADWAVVLQADVYGGYAKLYAGDRTATAVLEAACWAFARRKFYELADLEAAARGKAQGKTAVVAPLALEAVRRMDALFEIERTINGDSAAARRRSARAQCAARRRPAGRDAVRAPEASARLRRRQGHELHADPMARAQPLPRRRPSLHDQQRRRTRAPQSDSRPQGLLFAGSERGGRRAAFFYSVIVTAKLNDVDPQAWLADVLARIADHPAKHIDDLCRGTGRLPPALVTSVEVPESASGHSAYAAVLTGWVRSASPPPR